MVRTQSSVRWSSLVSMETTQPRVSFSELFGAAFGTLKSNYSLCLGLSFMLLVILFVTVVVIFALGMVFSTKEALYPGAIAGIIAQFTLFTLIITPLTVVFTFLVIARIRDEKGMRSGWLVRVYLISFIAHLLLLPALICSQLGDPGSFEVLKLIPETLTLESRASAYRQSGTPVPAEVKQAADQLKEEADYFEANRSPVLRSLGGVFYVVALFIIVTWLPWAVLAACDPRERCQSLSETLARGSLLASGAKVNLILTYVVVMVISGLSFVACGLPGIFFGFPLAFAWIPGSYLLLRDRGSESSPAVPA